MAKKKEIFPFDENGGLINEPNFTYKLNDDELEKCLAQGEFLKAGQTGNVLWKVENSSMVFVADIIYDSYKNRRSTTLIFVRDINTGIKYPMFIAEYDRMLNNARTMGTVHGAFTFIRRGANYSLKWVRDVE